MTAQFNEYERLNKDRFSIWRKCSITARGRFEVLADYRPWTQDHRMDGVPKLPRAYELLDIGYSTFEKQQQKKAELDSKHDSKRRRNSTSVPTRSPKLEYTPFEQNLYADFSQAAQRHVVTKGIGTLHNNSWVFSYEKVWSCPAWPMRGCKAF